MEYKKTPDILLVDVF